MAAKPKLTPEEWAKVRNTWESDPREGYAWIVESMALPVSAPGVRKVSLRDKWKKSEKPSKSTKTPKETINSEPKSKVSKVSQRNHAKVSETINVETINDEPETIEEADENPGGRPTLYKEEYNDQVHRLCVLGVTDEEIAKYFGVCKDTINNWKKEHPKFFDSMQEGKMEADADVAMSTYKSATGGHYVEEEKVVGVEVRNLRRQIPPDVAAQRMWLFNRRPKEWKNKIELKEDINLNVFPPKEVLDTVYAEALEVARKRDEMLIGRRERLGIVIDHDTGLIDD